MQISKVEQTELDSILDKEKNQVVSDSLETLRLGRPPTPRSPLFSDLPENQVWDSWLAILDREKSKYPRLIDYEFTRLEKVGPQGGYPPFASRLDELKAYYTNPRSIKISNESRSRIIIKLRDYLFGSSSQKRPLEYASIVKRDTEDDKLNTNSGCPLYSKRSDPFVQRNAISDANSGKWRHYPAILGSRSQRGKWRFIFMFPFSTNLVEKSFLLPLMDIIRSRNVPSFSAWEGFDEVETSMHNQGFFSAKTKVSMDFTKMDTHCGEEFMNFVYDVISPVFQTKFQPLLRESLIHACNIDVMIGIDKKVTGSHGLASGSGWTNFTESVYAQGIRFYLEDKFGIPLIGDQGLGDDGAFSSNLLDKQYVADSISEASDDWGQDSKPEKQSVNASTCIYLQRFFDDSILIKNSNVVAGSYPSVLALNTAMNPERFHDPRKWSEKMEILRWIMILENCKHNPMFHQLIEFFVEGDKYKLGLTIPGFFKRGIVNTYEEAKTIPGFVPSYNQSSLDRGIQDFETVKYLRAKSG